MANKVKPMLQIRRILQLIDKGVSLRGVSRELTMSFNTVKKYQQIVKKKELSNGQLPVPLRLYQTNYPKSYIQSEFGERFYRRRIINVGYAYK